MAISLKAARVNVGMSRPDVIKQLNDEYGIKLSINSLANYENKQTQPDITTGKALASIYGMSVDDILWSA